MTTRPLLGSLALGLVLVLGGCGSDDAASDATTQEQVSATEHNEADVRFATGMIPHHAQALAMVDMTVGRDLSPEMTVLTEEIRAAQAPEIEEMSDWLQEWGEEVPETMRDHANAHGGHGDVPGGDLPGMMSADEMGGLQDAPQGRFEEMWLRMMIEHHEGAIEMARTEQDEGRYEPALDLAGRIVESQTAEIETMEQMLR